MTIGKGLWRRSALAFGGLAAALALPGACGGPQEAVGKGESCFRADDCAAGLICINGACDDDLSKIVSQVDGPVPVADTGAGGAAGTGGAADSGRDATAGSGTGGAGPGGSAGAGGTSGAMGAGGTAGRGGAGGTAGSAGVAGSGGSAAGSSGAAGTAGSDGTGGDGSMPDAAPD